jgi:hypothetical protein
MRKDMQPNTYGIAPLFGSVEANYNGAAGTLPGAVAMSVGILANLELVDSGAGGVQWQNMDGFILGWQLELERVTIAGLDQVRVRVFIDAFVKAINIGAVIGKQTYLIATLDGTDLRIYVNGEQIGDVIPVLPGPVTPVATAPRLSIDQGAILTTVFYTQRVLTGLEITGLQSNAALSSLVPISTVDHIYNAERSLRPAASVQDFADTGFIGGVPLVAELTNTVRGAVRPTDYGQPVIIPPVGP